MTANPGTRLKTAEGWESVAVNADTIDQGVAVIDVGDPPGVAVGVISGRGGMSVNPDTLGNTDKAGISFAGNTLGDDTIIVCGYVALRGIGDSNAWNTFATLKTIAGLGERRLAIRINIGANTHEWTILDNLGVPIVIAGPFTPAIGVPFPFWFYWITKKTAPTQDFLYVEHLPSGPNRGRTGSGSGGFAQPGSISISGSGPAFVFNIDAVNPDSDNPAKGNGNHIEVDDWAIYGPQGMHYGIYAGVVRGKPSADTAENAWVPTGPGVGNWDRWEEIPPDDAVTYLSTLSGAAVRQKSQIQNGNVMVDTRSGGGPAGLDEVGLCRVPIAVVQRLRAESPGATDEIHFRGGIAGGTTLTGPADTPAVGFRSNLDFWTREQTPEATPRDWNPPLIDAMEWGVESAGAGVGSRDVTGNYPNVVYEIPNRFMPFLV